MKILTNRYLLTFLVVTATAQIKVDATGKIAIGSSTVSSTSDLKMEGSILYGDADYVGKTLQLNFDNNYVDFSPTDASNLGYLGKVHPWKAIFASAISSNTMNTVNLTASYNISTLDVNVSRYASIYELNATTVYAGAYYTTSDERIKRNIVEITNEYKGLLDLRPVSYNYDNEALQNLGNIIDVSDENRKHVGLLAQEIKEVYPHLVSENENSGILNVNYTGLIPYLVKAYQEQQVLITALQQQLSEKTYSKSAALDIENDAETSSMLAQNIPNPFTQNTTIAYTLGEEVTQAVLYVFNMSGSLVSTYTLAPGTSRLTIEGNTLNPGMYIYTLACDGKEIDSKRMILTK